MKLDHSHTNWLEAQACKLLLRSPRLSVSQIMELMDIGDGEFRQILKDNTEIALLIEQRKDGCLASAESEPRECPVCGDWYLPYASARCCSDECTQTALLRTRPDAARRLRAKRRAHKFAKPEQKST